ncbi:MAG: Mov34/MPN/PAD-1 family protein [Candidatus Helarchaeota archaeon]
MIPRIKELQITESQILELNEWVKKNDPYEACALLIGTYNQKIAKVEEIVLTPNQSRSRIHFEIDPELLLQVLLDIEDNPNKHLISIFHSHPSTPYPSGIDIPFMKNYPGAIWLIKGLPETEPMRAYQWLNHQIVEVKVTIVSNR